MIEWPSGDKQVLENVPSGHRIEVQEGSAGFHAAPFRAFREMSGPDVEAARAKNLGLYNATWLLEPITPPGFSAA